MPEISEEWILEQLESETPDTAGLLRALDVGGDEARVRDVLGWAQLIEETFTTRGDYKTVLGAMQRRAAVSSDGNGKNDEYSKAAAELLKHDRDMRRMIEDAGFDKKLKPSECLRRLLTLLNLAPGIICYDATWGQGVVREIDMFYHRVEIDFERKRSHQLSLAYAAEALELLEVGHLLAICHTTPEKIDAMIADEPAELVKLTISSMGDMTAEQLKEVLVPRILDEAAWKSFWDSARKALKKDPLFDLPAKRKEPMRILNDEAELHGIIWFEELGKLRSMDELISKLELCLASIDAIPSDQAILAIVADRLQFVITGSLRNFPDLAARALLIADAFGLDEATLDTRPVYTQFLSPELLKTATDRLPSKYLKPFISNLLRHDQTGASTAIIDDLPNFSLPVLTEIMDLLIEMGYEEPIAAKFRENINKREINAKMLLWILRNDGWLAKWGLRGRADLVPILFRILENEQTDDDPADYKRLRSHCEKSSWIKAVMGEMTPLQRKEFTTRVMHSSAWSSLDRKSLLARIIKIDPDMQAVVTPSDENSKPSISAARQTSIRSYNARMRQLEKLTNTEIPENSRELAEARSHGDLRENAEFKAAKERQGLLMQRQGELEQDLRAVNPSDFSEGSCDAAGPGTMVTIAYDDGSSIEYTILGEWDRDEELNIISSNSRLAGVLRGRRSGERISIPSETGEAEITVERVTALNQSVQDWIKA